MKGSAGSRTVPAGRPAQQQFATKEPLAAPAPAPANAMTVDVEDYFQVSAMEPVVSRSGWEGYASRVERNTERVLKLFDDAHAKATFFTLGWVAQRFPGIVRSIVDSGHEIASHGWEHVRVSTQEPQAFRHDVRRTKELLEDISGVAVRGYRAASFSLTKQTGWAHRILEEEGYAYSSSIYPIRHDHYGIPDAPRFAYRPMEGSDFLELPLTTVAFGGRRLPCGGGGYFRLLPYRMSTMAMRRVNTKDREPCIFYFHPWEIDPGQPRIAGAGWRTRFRHYTNLGVMERRLSRVLGSFSWDRMDRVFLQPGKS